MRRTLSHGLEGVLEGGKTHTSRPLAIVFFNKNILRPSGRGNAVTDGDIAAARARRVLTVKREESRSVMLTYCHVVPDFSGFYGCPVAGADDATARAIASTRPTVPYTCHARARLVLCARERTRATSWWRCRQARRPRATRAARPSMWLSRPRACRKAGRERASGIDHPGERARQPTSRPRLRKR